MDSESWHTCTELLNATIDRPHNARKAFLDGACNGDEALRRKVELLLKYHDKSGDFIEAPAFAVAPELLVEDHDALIGQRLGCYRVDAIVGTGGMGVVYRAYDERLERKVALKLMPRSLVADERQLERVRREARSASALNHPNIVTIHEIGSVDSIHFIATEFIEGSTLRERISAGPIPPNETLEIATQIASALGVAHAAGIVHRDIKPENVMLRPDGIVKVLDFGIARLIEQSGPRGEIIGTMRYMSPEQRQGEPVDPRSDLWSFGVVFAEMLADAGAATMQRIIERCLRKDPAARYQTSNELLGDLRGARRKIQARRARYLLWTGLSAAAALLVWFALFNPPANTPLASNTAMTVSRPTQNPEAYVFYLRAREFELANESSGNLVPATELYQKAIDLDPSFALARARLSVCASRIADMGLLGEWKTKARAEAEQALRLQPQLGEARLALGHYYLWSDKDYERALAEIGRAAELLPNSAEVATAAAYIYKRQNKYRERVAALDRAATLDPRSLRANQLLTNTLEWLREWPEAMRSFDRYEAIVPQQQLCSWRWRRARDEFQLTGDINVLRGFIKRERENGSPVNAEWLAFACYETSMLERDYGEAARCLSAVPPDAFVGRPHPLSAHSKVFHEALLAVAANSDATAKLRTLERAQNETEKRVAAFGRTVGLDKPHADLALLHAFCGRKNDAVRQAEKGIEVWPGPGTIEKNEASAALAMVYAQTGEPEKAIVLIEHLLTMPVELQRGAVYNLTLTDLKWRWQWDPLRSHPRFRQIIAGPEPKTVY